MSKKITILIAALVLAALILTGPAWPGTLPSSLVPEGARWVVHVDMEQFVATELYKELAKEDRFKVKGTEINRLLKIDWRKDISGLTIFGLGAGKEQVVFAAAGRFDKPRLLTLLDLDTDHQDIPYGAFTVYSTGDDEFWAFINDGLIVFSESREAMERVLDTAGGKAKSFVSSELNAAFQDISSGAFLSGVIENLAGMGREIAKSKFAGKAKSLSFLAREVQDSLKVRVLVTADSPENAKRMADMAQGLAAMIQLEEKEGEKARWASLAKEIQVKLEGKAVRLELDMPSRDIVNLTSHELIMNFFD